MPGPMSAPNGQYSLTLKAREPGTKTGKTAKKNGFDFSSSRESDQSKGISKAIKANRKPKMSRKRREEQEAV